MSESSSSSSSGIGFVGLLTIVFIVLKLLGKIHWSWWWVLSPSLVGITFWLLVVGGVGLILLISWLNDQRIKRKRAKAINAATAPKERANP